MLLCTIQHHTQQELHAQRGNDVITLRHSIDSVDEFDGEIIALLHELCRFGGKFKRLVRVVLIIVPANFFAGHKGHNGQCRDGN